MITFTSEAEAHIAFFLSSSKSPLSLRRTWDAQVTSKDGRIVLRDSGVSLAVCGVEAQDEYIPLLIAGHTVYMSFADFSALRGATIYLSNGNSADPTVTSGELLKVA